MQVLDMLLSAGFDHSDHRLILFRVCRVCPIAMRQFIQAADFRMFHKDLLVETCDRGKRTASFETVSLKMLHVGECSQHIIDLPEEPKGFGSIERRPGTPMSDHFKSAIGSWVTNVCIDAGVWVFVPHLSLTIQTPLGSEVRQLITYVVHDSFPLIEILDTINVALEDIDVTFPKDSKTCCLLHKNATSHIKGPKESQTCFGVKLIQR